MHEVIGWRSLTEEYYWNSDGETADRARPRQVLVTISTMFR
jgi:hypothetical protein